MLRGATYYVYTLRGREIRLETWCRRRSSRLHDIYFREKRFSKERKREREVLFRLRNSVDFNWKRNVVEWIALGKRFLGKITSLSSNPFTREREGRGWFKNILLPFDDGRRGSPFRRHWLLLHHIPAHPIPNHALYPLTGQNQHDCG